MADQEQLLAIITTLCITLVTFLELFRDVKHRQCHCVFETVRVLVMVRNTAESTNQQVGESYNQLKCSWATSADWCGSICSILMF